jgi:hypothetical protein
VNGKKEKGDEGRKNGMRRRYNMKGSESKKKVEKKGSKRRRKTKKGATI